MTVLFVYMFTFTVGVASSKTHGLQQTWLINLRNTCGEKYETDADGNLIANSNGMYAGTVVEFASIFGIYGMFIGQLLFRVRGFGRLEASAFTSQRGFVHQIIYMGFMYVIFMSPEWMSELISNDVSHFVEAVFVIGIPSFLTCLVITFFLPVVSSNVAQYPVVMTDLPNMSNLLPEPMKKIGELQLERSMFIKSSSTNGLLGKY